MSRTQSYAVYLTNEVALDGDPLHADAVDFHDSGVWVTHADGRDFVPYGRVLRIREAHETETTGERRDAASRATGTASLDPG
jgi:hypothetical protein